MTSSKAGIYGESFQCRTEKLGLCSSPCGYGVYQGKELFITAFARNTAWVAKRNCLELSYGCPCMVTRWWRNQFCQFPHCLTLLSSVLCLCLGVCMCLGVSSPVHSCKAGFYAPTEVSLKLLHSSEEGWHQQLVELFPPPHRLSFCLSVFLSQCWQR